MVGYYAVKSSSRQKRILVPPGLVSHRMQSSENLEMQILSTVFEALRLSEELLSDMPQWLMDLFIFHHFDHFNT